MDDGRGGMTKKAVRDPPDSFSWQMGLFPPGGMSVPGRNRRTQAPNRAAACFMFSTMGTPKGHRFSQAPQATHSAAQWGSRA